MADHGTKPADFGARLAELADKHQVPGAQLGILRAGGDTVTTACRGILNANSGQPVTPDSVFQIGSITKIYTTTMIMALVESGRLALDTRVIDVLPELRLADSYARDHVTVWHLLTHTSGIDGDLFTDTGRGDDCLAAYLDVLAGARQIHPLGATYSYCNSGFSLAGRMIERITGQVWDDALRDLLLSPLGVVHTVTLPEQALLGGSVAVGHIDADVGQRVTPQWQLPRSSGPAGAVVATAADVLAFAHMHLLDGLAPGLHSDGEAAAGSAAAPRRVLGQDSARAMRQVQVAQPDRGTSGDSRGLGWVLSDWNGEFVYGHDGGTMGQTAYLRIHPASGTAVVLLTNGGNGQMLYEELFSEVFAQLVGIAKPDRVAPPAGWEAVDVSAETLSEIVGTYERAEQRIEVVAAPAGLRIREVDTSPFADVEDIAPTSSLLAPLGDGSDGRFARYSEELGAWGAVTFYALDATGQRYVHVGGRTAPKI